MTTFILPPFRGCLLEKERSNLKKDRDFVSKKRAKKREREREVIVLRGAKSRTLEDSRHSSGRSCTDRAKVIPAWCATVLHTANGVGNSLGLAVPGISALLLARYPPPRPAIKTSQTSWRPTIPSSPTPFPFLTRVSGSIRANGNGFRAEESWSLASFESFLLSCHDGR